MLSTDVAKDRRPSRFIGKLMLSNSANRPKLNAENHPQVSQHGSSPTDVAKGWRRGVMLACAGVSFVLGVLGFLLPVIPATPFLLLTSHLLIRSSPRLNQRLMHSRWFGSILVDWQQNGGVRKHVKVKAIILVVVTVALTIYYSGYSAPFAIAIVGLASVGITVVYRLPVADDASEKTKIKASRAKKEGWR